MGGRAPRDNTAAILVEQQRQQTEREERNAREARENREREEARRAEQEAANRARFQNDLRTTVDLVRGQAADRLRGLGLDPNAYAPRIENALTATRMRVPENSEGLAQFFNTDFVDTLLNEDRSLRRQNATARVQRELPNDFSSLFSSSADDPFVDQILGRQSNEARSMLERAQRRGNLTDDGFQAGLGRIGELERGGRAQAQALGDSVINRFRTEASDVRNRALERAGSIDIFEPDFDISSFSNQLSDVQNRFSSNLGGEIESALAGQSFFDIGDVLNRAGVAQGAQNPSATTELSPAALLAERRRREQEQAQRGVGGGGTF